jgi:hypothetical protein
VFSREYLERLGAETGFRPDTLEKVLRLERLLTGIRRHPFLGERLVLKGGTALNLFFGGPVPRLSVDLDLNYVHTVDREEMLREKPEVERALRTLAEGDRYRLQWGRDEHAGRKIHFWYRNGLGSDDHIELDVNFLHRVPLVPVVERDGWTPDTDFPCRAMLAGTEEILAGKILALLNRGAPRDLYDVAGMAGGRFPYDADLFRPLFLAFSGVLDRSVTTYVVPHRRTLSQAELDEQLIPVLRGGEHPNQAALTMSITPLISSLVALSAEEQEYVERIQWGEFRPELVIKNRAALLEQIRRHPGLLWKVENGRRRARR